MTTFWLAFHDPDASSDKRFLGVAIFDMDESNGECSAAEIAQHAWKLGVNPGGQVVICDVTGDALIRAEHKNRLITDDDLLLALGSSGRNLKNTH
jgi:hypothetical protein